MICPLRYDASHKIFLTDIMRLTGFPVLLVSPSGLGAINAAVLSARYLEQEGIPVLGFLLNGYEEGNFLHEDNRHMIEELSGLPVIGHAAFQAKTLEESLLKYLLWPSQNGFIC